MAMQGVYRSQASASLSALPPGLMQLYSEGIKQGAQGITAAGEGIADAIDKYKEGKERTEFLTEEFEALQGYADELGMQRQYESGGADSFSSDYPEEFAKTIAKFHDMSTSQQEGAIVGLKFKISQADKARAFEEQKRHTKVMEGQGQAGIGLRRKGLEEQIKQFQETQGFREQVHTDTTSRNEKQDEWKQEAARNAANALDVYRQNQLNNDDRLFRLKKGEIEKAAIIEARNQRAILMGAGVIPSPSTNYAPGSPEAQPYQYADALKGAGDFEGQKFIVDKFSTQDKSKIGTSFKDPNTGQWAMWTSEGQIQFVDPDIGEKQHSDFISYVGNEYNTAIGGNDADYGAFLKDLTTKIKDPAKRMAYIQFAHKHRKDLMAATRADKYRALSESQNIKVKGFERDLERATRNLAAAENAEEQNKARGGIQEIENRIEKIYEEAGKRQPSRIGLIPGSKGVRKFNTSTGKFDD